MKLGALSTTLSGEPFGAGLDLLRDLGVQAVEIACAGFQRDLTYGDPAALLASDRARTSWLDAIARRGLEISALSIHGQPLHPNPAIAREYGRQFEDCCRLAELIGVQRLTLLAGLPEGAPGDSTPCWIVSAFPPANRDVLAWQWEERVLPYWERQAATATAHGCLLCFEMHPCDVVYNPASLLRLHEAIGPAVACNFDPSHLFWQGIDPLAALRELGGLVRHVHCKDTRLQLHVADVNGVLDTTPWGDPVRRAWNFRTLGYGHPETFWTEFLTTLRGIGYEDVLSVEHEDAYIELREGLRTAVAFLKRIMLEQPAGRHWIDPPSSVNPDSGGD